MTDVIIEARNLGKTYKGEIPTVALKSATFSIARGDFVAVMGPSGSGKSTLLHILGFLDRHTSGDYFFDGKTYNDYSEEELARIRNKKMGFVFQAFNLLSRATVLENVMLPLLYSGVEEKLWEEMARASIHAVGLAHRLRHDPSRLSGGEKQRVAIARALVTEPEVIFADEPTGNLDSKSGGAVMSLIQELNEERGHTIILITHETYTAEHAMRILSLKDGEIVGDTQVNHRHKGFKK